MKRQDLWFLRTRDGEIIGPFPGSMLIRHQLLGRVKATDDASQDGVNWRSVADYPELRPMPAVVVSEPADLDDPFWNEERAKAKLRWADERETGDRRNEISPEQIQVNARTGKDRRAPYAPAVEQRHPAKLHGDGAPNWVAIAIVLLGCAALVAGLFWLGTVAEPVIPVRVKIGR